ncbi:MAG TPA: hypothetical protein DEA62_02390 [Coxiellaceae bacterium]|nr:hypothetical protein [Coxiellaceae bacterium]HBY55920.1 hypothetical protein [Coxiellaceae bacterium]
MQNCNSLKPIYKIIFTVLIISLAILTLFFLYIHRAHLAAYSGLLSLVIIFACPLMHLFMHGGHSHKNHGSNSMSCHHKSGHESKHEHDEHSDKQEGNNHE